MITGIILIQFSAFIVTLNIVRCTNLRLSVRTQILIREKVKKNNSSKTVKKLFNIKATTVVRKIL